MGTATVRVSFGAPQSAPNAGHIVRDANTGAIQHLAFTKRHSFADKPRMQMQHALREAMETVVKELDPERILLEAPHIENAGLAIGRLPPSLRTAVSNRIETRQVLPEMHAVFMGLLNCYLARRWSVTPDKDVVAPYKAYVDASFLHGKSQGSIGYVVTDATGEVVMLRACPVGNQPTSHTTEVVGVRLLLNDVSHVLGQNTPIIVNTDCSYVTDKLQNPSDGRRPALIKEIRGYVEKRQTGVNHVPRDDTEVADELATFGRKNTCEYVDPRLPSVEALPSPEAL